MEKMRQWKVWKQVLTMRGNIYAKILQKVNLVMQLSGYLYLYYSA